MGTASIVLIILIVIFVPIIMIVLYVIKIYNKLVTLRNRFKNAFAQIEVQLKRRYDLIPNLVEIAKKYLKHEEETLVAVTQARNQAAAALGAAAANPGNAEALQGLMGAESGLMGAMSRLMVVQEAYPELKADKQMSQLTEELTSTENKIAFSRQAFNDAVTIYNTFRQSFPPVFFANMFGHATDAQLLEFDDAEQIKEAPKVAFD
jgi:LemA protein